MNNKVITGEMLSDMAACDSQVNIFEDEWLDGGVMTLQNVVRATELSLDLDWFASRFLSDPARKAYDEAVDPARKAYFEVVDLARKAYNEVVGLALYNAWQLM